MAVYMVTGMVLIHAPASALNNAGIEAGRMADNKMVVKKIRVGRAEYPYVSGQAFRRWWRETVLTRFDWTPSPVTREEKIAYTAGNPISYEEDDIFGYMLAPAAKGMEKGLVYRRISPLKVTPLVSCFPNVITEDFGVMARGAAESEPVPFEQEFYSTILKGAFSLMMSEVGVFRRGQGRDLPADDDGQQKSSGPPLKKFEQRVNDLKRDAAIKGAQVTDDRIFLPDTERRKRIKETLLALAEISGGAKLADFLTDVTPRLVIAAILDCANHIFLDVTKVTDNKVTIDIDAVEEIIRDYCNHLKSSIYLGIRKGFLDDVEYERLKEWASNGIKVNIVFGTPKEVIKHLVSEIDKLNL